MLLGQVAELHRWPQLDHRQRRILEESDRYDPVFRHRFRDPRLWDVGEDLMRPQRVGAAEGCGDFGAHADPGPGRHDEGRVGTCPSRGKLIAGAVAMAAVMLIAAGCGSTPERDPFDEPVATTGQEQVPEEEESDEAPSADDIKVEDSLFVYLPEATGGKFHDAYVLLRNESDQVAVNVSGQISIMEDGELIQSLNPIPVNILPGEEGLFTEENLDLPMAVTDGELEVDLAVERFVEWTGESPVSFSDLAYRHSFLGCEITGVVHNTFSEEKDDLQLRVAGFVDESLDTGGFTYVDHVFPERDATFEVTMFSSAKCPPKLDEIGVYPNLGEDKIFNP